MNPTKAMHDEADNQTIWAQKIDIHNICREKPHANIRNILMVPL